MRRMWRRWRATSCGQRFGADADTAGYKVYTTIDGAAAERRPTARVRIGLIEYDRRHGWRGATGQVDLPRHGDAGLRRLSRSTPRSAT